MKVPILSAGVALTVALIWFAGEGANRFTRAEDVPTFTEVLPPKTDSPEATPLLTGQDNALRERSDSPSPATNATGNAIAAPGDKAVTAGTASGSGELPVTPATFQPGPALAEMIKLVRAGVGDEILLAYVTNSVESFEVGSEEILFLRDLGVSAPVITTLIQHDSSPEIVARRKAATASTPLPPGLALNAPAKNIYPPTTSTPAPVNPPEPTPVSPPATAEASGGSETSSPESNFETSIPPAAVVVDAPISNSYFYSEMSPYGTWVETAAYGRCWRPFISVRNPHWRPYADGGRWIWTDRGWYWYSDYSWGWAPFHYGRWACDTGIGWLWIPDTCWGPSWVSWRYTGSHCGWAPLPPSARYVRGHGFYHNTVSVGVGFDFGLSYDAWVFLPLGSFCHRRVSDHLVARSHAQHIYRSSVVANDYGVLKGGAVVNRGIGVERISHATRSNIRPATLRSDISVRSIGSRRELLAQNGTSIHIATPPAGTPRISPPARPITALSQARARMQADSFRAQSSPASPAESRAGLAPSSSRASTFRNVAPRTAGPTSVSQTPPAPGRPTGASLPQAGGPGPDRVTDRDRDRASRRVPGPSGNETGQGPRTGRTAVGARTAAGDVRPGQPAAPTKPEGTIRRAPQPASLPSPARPSAPPTSPASAPPPTLSPAPGIRVQAAPAPVIRMEPSRPSSPPAVVAPSPAPRPAPAPASSDSGSRGHRSSADGHGRRDSR